MTESHLVKHCEIHGGVVAFAWGGVRDLKASEVFIVNISALVCLKRHL